MRKIIIREEVMNVIRANAILPFRDTSRKLDCDKFEIEIGEDIYEEIERLRFVHESISDTLLRIFAKVNGKIN